VPALRQNRAISARCLVFPLCAGKYRTHQYQCGCRSKPPLPSQICLDLCRGDSLSKQFETVMLRIIVIESPGKTGHTRCQHICLNRVRGPHWRERFLAGTGQFLAPSASAERPRSGRAEFPSPTFLAKRAKIVSRSGEPAARAETPLARVAQEAPSSAIESIL